MIGGLTTCNLARVRDEIQEGGEESGKKAKPAKSAKKAVRKAAKNIALTDMAMALLSGQIKVIDLTATLGPETPLHQAATAICRQHAEVEVHDDLAL